MAAQLQEYRCAACGGVLPLSRREHHERYWCTARAPSPDDELSDDSDGDDDTSLNALDALRQALPGEARARTAMLAPTFHNATRYSFVHAPGLEFVFEQQSVFGDCDTGGALWFSEIVVAEWLARRGPGRGRLLELGCGAAPAAGLAAFAAGWDVVFTDVAAVLPSTRRNIEVNAAACGRPLNDPNALDLLAFDWNGPLPDRVALLAPSFATIVVSDCLFRATYHAPLARTLAALLAAAGPAAPEILVAFQLRDDADLLFFTHALPYFGLRGDRIDIDAHLAGLRWHNVPSHAIRDHLFLYGVVAAAAPR